MNETPVGPHTALYKIRQQDQYKDEQQGPWPATARGPSNKSTPMDDNPIFSVEDSLWYWSNPFFVNWQGIGQKVACNKLVAGVPLYGYDFAYKKDPDPESGQTPPGYKVLRYKELVQQFSGANTAANANIKVSGNTPRPSFVSAAGTYPYAHNIYLETPDTAVARNFSISSACRALSSGRCRTRSGTTAKASSKRSTSLRQPGDPPRFAGAQLCQCSRAVGQ